MTLPWHLYLMAGMYIFAGMMHFIKPKAYMRIMPRYIPNHRPLVYLSGLAEILLGIGLLFEQTRVIAIWGIITMLIVFFLVHFYMLSSDKAGMGLPKWLLWGRILLQFVLIWWAYFYMN